MIIYIASDGQARLVSPQHVYQGSSVTDITVVAPFPSQTAMTVAFSLPDGKMFGGVQGTIQTPPYLMTLLANQPELPNNVYAWQYVMPFAITQNAGQAKVSITAQFAQGSGEAASFTQQTSAQVEFAIEPSVVGTLPDEPTPDVWTQILSYLSAQDTKIAAIQSDVADIEQVADEANTNADAALTTANKANTTATQAKTTADGIDGKATQALANSQTAEQTAQEAKTTADGLADSIAQANATASQANATADEAKEIAEGAAQGNGTRVSVGGAFQQTLSFTSDPQTQIAQNATAVAAAEQSITDIENGTTTVAKASEATKASQDGDGNNIADTYALLPTSVTNTPCASGQWAVSAAAGPGTYLIGTFSVYDSNIHLKISGGIAINTADNTTDAEVFISTTNYTVEKAVCFANKLYTTSTRTGIYYTIDSSHNLRIFAPMSDYGKLFISAEITGGTIVGKGDGSLQYPSGGEYIETNYYFATDPSKLAPSTANGWTQTTATGSLPGAGVYLVAHDVDTAGNLAGVGVMFYGGVLSAGAAIVDFDGLHLLSYLAHGTWSLRNSNGTEVNMNNVYYKRIA